MKNEHGLYKQDGRRKHQTTELLILKVRAQGWFSPLNRKKTQLPADSSSNSTANQADGTWERIKIIIEVASPKLFVLQFSLTWNSDFDIPRFRFQVLRFGGKLLQFAPDGLVRKLILFVLHEQRTSRNKHLSGVVGCLHRSCAECPAVAGDWRTFLTGTQPVGYKWKFTGKTLCNIGKTAHFPIIIPNSDWSGRDSQNVYVPKDLKYSFSQLRTPRQLQLRLFVAYQRDDATRCQNSPDFFKKGWQIKPVRCHEGCHQVA